MPNSFMTTFRLIPPEERGPDARGLSLDAEGLVLGPHVKLIYPVGSGARRTYVARTLPEVKTLLCVAYGQPVPIERITAGLRAVVNALNRGDLCTANIAAVLLALPDLPDANATNRLARADAALRKFNPEERRDDYGRWTTGDQVADAGPRHGRSALALPDAAFAFEKKQLSSDEWNGIVSALRELDGSTSTEQLTYALIYLLEGGKR
jgi:hypothetical protein